MIGAPPLRLGYVVIESERLDDWEQFARDGIGLHADRLSPELLALRIDDRQRRIIIRRGPAEDAIALGWETDDAEALARMHAHLVANAITPDAGPLSEANARGIEGYFGFLGRKGLRHEFFADARRTNQPLAARVSGFVTGAGGLGHVALFTREPEALTADMQRLLGARLSDTITDRLMGLEMEFSFLHLNERHHSLAIAATSGIRLDPIRTRIQHLMLEAATLEDVGDAYLRCRELGIPIAMGMGQHPNDRGLSFYAVSPSGFEVELGHAPLQVGPDWQVKSYRGISKWGHRPEFEQGAGDKLKAGWAALKSLFHSA
jgi:2,3-dihydroxybiphenyl 1,2-dioxygenase